VSGRGGERKEAAAAGATLGTPPDSGDLGGARAGGPAGEGETAELSVRLPSKKAPLLSHGKQIFSPKQIGLFPWVVLINIFLESGS
jgi:hypothetical protein